MSTPFERKFVTTYYHYGCADSTTIVIFYKSYYCLASVVLCPLFTDASCGVMSAFLPGVLADQSIRIDISD